MSAGHFAEDGRPGWPVPSLAIVPDEIMAEAAATGWVRPDPAIFGEAVTWVPYKGAPGAQALLNKIAADRVLAEVDAWKIANPGAIEEGGIGDMIAGLPSWAPLVLVGLVGVLLWRR